MGKKFGFGGVGGGVEYFVDCFGGWCCRIGDRIVRLRVSNMRFDVLRVKNYLLNKGFVYSVRKYNVGNGFVFVDGVGLCYRVNLGLVVNKGVVDYDKLGKFVKYSGFDRIVDWVWWIKRFRVVNGYLYKVIVVKSC